MVSCWPGQDPFLPNCAQLAKQVQAPSDLCGTVSPWWTLHPVPMESGQDPCPPGPCVPVARPPGRTAAGLAHPVVTLSLQLPQTFPETEISRPPKPSLDAASLPSPLHGMFPCPEFSFVPSPESLRSCLKWRQCPPLGLGKSKTMCHQGGCESCENPLSGHSPGQERGSESPDR